MHAPAKNNAGECTRSALRERNILRTPQGARVSRQFVAPLPQRDPTRLGHLRTLDRAHGRAMTGH
jgi:hypothetical protein